MPCAHVLQELLGDIEDLDLGAVVALELPVCEGLRFQLLTLHTREPLNELISILIDHLESSYLHQQEEARDKYGERGEQEQQQQSNDIVKSNSDGVDSSYSRSSDRLAAALDLLETNHICRLSELVRLQEDAEASCLLMHASPSLPLRHPPCQLALAALLASPIKRDMQQQGVDVEAILKQHVIAITAETPEAPAAAQSATVTTVPAAAATPSSASFSAAVPAASSLAEAVTADEARWLCVQNRVQAIVEELRNIRQVQKQIQGGAGAFSQRMAELLGKSIDAAEVNRPFQLSSCSAAVVVAAVVAVAPVSAVFAGAVANIVIAGQLKMGSCSICCSSFQAIGLLQGEGGLKREKKRKKQKKLSKE